MPPEKLHPSDDDLKGAVFGWLPGGEAEVVRAHAAACPTCWPLFETDEEVRRLLARLPAYEPPPGVDVVSQVLERIDRTATPRPRVARLVAAGLAAGLCLVLGALLVLAPDRLATAAQWLRSVVVRELPGIGQPGAPPATVGPTGRGSPMQSMSLEEARRSAPIPVALPRWLPEGFTLAEVAVFRPQPSGAATRVYVRYSRVGAHQPLVLTYQAAGTPSEVTAPPGGARQLTVAGHRAVYIAAAEGLRSPPEGGAAPQVGRLIVERPDVVLTAAGDRRDGLDADMLARVVASVP